MNPTRLALALALAFAMIDTSRAEDWGAYAIVPASAPSFVLEAVGAGTTEGTVVSIGRPSGSPHQKWTITPRGADLFAIRPSHAPNLVLAIAGGGDRMGTLAVLEADQGKPWQAWSLKKNENGSYGLVAPHAKDKGLDHFGGKPEAGAKVDLWANKAGDTHLEWLIRPLAGTPLAPAPGAGESPPSTYVPPAMKPEDIPRGTVRDFTLTSGPEAIFPGTVRQVSVFVPAQYDGSKPACVSVKFDGYNAAEKPLLEALIASGEMPVTVGVFVRPGELPPTVKGTIGRRNRCLEYDGVGDANVRFLVEELLPEVARKFDLKLSTSGNDRCISGGSSGAIAAFNAAWERPEAFSRVYANSGSFVAFRGGHEFPTLVRKFEPKPIRAYLTTGMRDMENAAGDWFLIDQEMDKALKFSGYDYAFRIINGGHVAGYYDHYREAMSYLWKGWPEPVKAGPGAPRVRDILLPDELWHLVAEGRVDPRGPAVNAAGEVFFVEGNSISRIDADGRLGPFLTNADGADGLAVGPKGELFAVSGRTGKVMSYDAAGKGTLVVDGLPGRHALATPSGGLYVSGAGDGGETWFVKDGKKSRVDAGLKLATGMAYRPDRWVMSVADGRSKWVYSYQVNDDGTLANKERFSWLHVPDWEDDAGAGSVCYAKEGPLLVATRWGIQVCADDGPTQVIIPLPDRARAVGVCLGGRDLDTLYAFGGGKVWARKVKVHGFGASTPFARMNGSKL
jgi:enterochelin esterase-like enzyme/sugar lactone lactonase YvrE